MNSDHFTVVVPFTRSADDVRSKCFKKNKIHIFLHSSLSGARFPTKFSEKKNRLPITYNSHFVHIF